MNNTFTLLFHIGAVGGITLIALRLGKEALIAWLSLCALTSNLFILKEISLWGNMVTCTDSLAVGYLLSLNLIQEFFGQKMARKTMGIAFFVVASFFLLSFFQIAYLPGTFDKSQNHYRFLLEPMPRIIISSLLSFFLVQFLDLMIFSWLRKKMEGRFFPLRALTSSLLCEGVDTILFSFLALSQTATTLWALIAVSFVIKALTILFFTPFLFFAKQVHKHDPLQV